MNLIIILYVAVLFAIGFRSSLRIKTVSDFFVAHKGGSFHLVAGSLTATILGGSAVIGAIDKGPVLGGATAWFLLCGAAGLLALLPFLKKICAIGRFSLPDMMEDLYGKGPRLTASIVIPIAWTGVVAAQIIASAEILQSFTGISYGWGAVCSGFVFIAYTMAGGQFSILKTDFLQAILIIAGLVLLAAFAFARPVIAAVPPPAFPFNENFSPLDLFLLLLTYGTTYTAGPDMFSRIFCAKDSRTAKRAILATAGTLIIIAGIIGYLSVFGASFDSGEGAKIIGIGREALPGFLLPVLAISLLSVVLSSADTTLLSSSIIITELFSGRDLENRGVARTRIVVLLNGLIALVIALHFTDIIGMMLLALAVYAGAFTLPVLLGVAGFRAKVGHVSCAILAGGVLALLGKLLPATSLGAHTGDVLLIAAFIVNGGLLWLGRIKPGKLKDQSCI